MTDKPARQITKLTEIIHEKDREIQRLTALANSRFAELQRQQIALDDALARELVVRRNKLASDAHVVELGELNDRAAKMIEVLETRASAAETALRSSETMRLDVCAKYEHAIRLLGDQQIIEDQRAALTKILDAVRDRMRRKEIEAERAVLNRKAVTAVVPERNFR